MVRKLGKRYSTLSATNDSFPIRRFRKIVLYPWAADILHRYVQELQNQGVTMAQIELMRLSDTKPGCPIFGPTEIENAMLPLLPQAGIDSPILPRTDNQGTGNPTENHVGLPHIMGRRTVCSKKNTAVQVMLCCTRCLASPGRKPTNALTSIYYLIIMPLHAGYTCVAFHHLTIPPVRPLLVRKTTMPPYPLARLKPQLEDM